MSDPAVTAFLTKQLCSHGGRLERDHLGDFLDLPAEQIEQILQDEKLRFPQISQLVLAQSSLRICYKYLFPNDPKGEEEDEEKCPKLHVCRHYLRGQCPRRTNCRFSHDVLSDHNRAVLKANELSGLNEDEIKVLLFQNDNQLLPEDCPKYVRGSCDKGEDCMRLHMCRFFTLGACNRRACQRSHNLLESKIILNCSWMSLKTVENFQMLCLLKHNERHWNPNYVEAKEVHWRARGRGRRRGRSQVSVGRSRERNINGPRIPSTSRPASQCSGGQRSGDEDFDHSPSDSDSHDTHSEKRDDNVISPCSTTVQVKPFIKNTDPTADQIKPQQKAVSRSAKPVSPSAVGPSTVPLTPPSTLVTSPMGAPLMAEAIIRTDVSPKPAAAVNVKEDSSVKSSSIPEQKLIREVGNTVSPSVPLPASSSTSKTSLYTSGEIADTAQPKLTTLSNRPLSPPVAGASRVPATSSTTLLTTPTRDSPKAESISSDIASPKPSAASNLTNNLSAISSYLPGQEPIMGTAKTVSSPVTGPANILPTSSSSSKTSSYFTRDVPYTARANPGTSTVSFTGTSTVQFSSSSSLPNPATSSSGSVRTGTTCNKLSASVEPRVRSEVPSGNQYTKMNEENKAFNLPPKSTSSTVTQPQAATNTPSAAPRKASPDETPEICLSNIWKFCKFGGRCTNMHYYLPYRWQLLNGADWIELPNMEDIEKAYCDPSTVGYQSFDFRTMKLGTRRIRRLSTPSSVTKPSEYVLTTEWIWYWKDEFGTWTKYSQANTKNVSSSICSSDLENIYLSDPAGTIQFSAGNQNYIINCQEMRQRNILYKTEKEVRRRPVFLDSEKVKMLKGSTKSPQTSSSSPLQTGNYPELWDTNAVPDIGYQKVLVLGNSGEFSNIVKMFSKTVSGHAVKKLWRVQNPSLWQVYQWQKDQMKKKKSAINVDERQLFHGTDSANIDTICKENFDWRVCGTNGTVYGQGSYFARDASYSHNYSLPTTAGTRTMFVARVLVGDFAVGDSTMRRPPQRYDSCVDNIRNPSIFVVFEKLQIYPEYLLEYEEEKKSSCILS